MLTLGSCNVNVAGILFQQPIMCLEAKVFLDTYMSIALGHNKCMQIIQPSCADVTTAAAPTPSNMATKMTINLAELQYKNSH